jgi:hypothetical protein
VTGVAELHVARVLVLLEEAHEFRAPRGGPARHAVVGDDVLGEAVAELVEQLVVEAAPVPVHRLLHPFDVLEGLDPGCQLHDVDGVVHGTHPLLVGPATVAPTGDGRTCGRVVAGPALPPGWLGGGHPDQAPA